MVKKLRKDAGIEILSTDVLYRIQTPTEQETWPRRYTWSLGWALWSLNGAVIWIRLGITRVLTCSTKL
jgi:hypothetical protein